MDIGGKIKEMRERKSLTIKQLSEMVPCSPSLISQIERGKADPSISTLKKIAVALNSNIIDFFSDTSRGEEVVMREADRTVIRLPRWDARIQCLTRNVARRKMQAFYTIIRPGGGSRCACSHEGEEFGIVLSGEMELVLGDETHVVRKDESFYFSSATSHKWSNKGDEDVIVVSVITPPTF